MASTKASHRPGLSTFCLQTAKVRFTRTTSTVQHLMEARRDGHTGASHLFGCLRRTSSSQTLQYEEESSRPGPVNPTLTNSTRIVSEESEKRRQELERTRREVKRLDRLLDEQKKKDRSEHLSSITDAWITHLPPESDDSPATTSCWEWCLSAEQAWPPHVDLEPFSGEPKDWPDFIHRFKIWIHDAMPNDALRMIYLEELLSPEIRDKHSSFFSHSGCYRQLLVHLRDHYGSPYLVARSCFTALKQLPPVDPDNLKTIVTLSHEVKNIAITLQMAGCEGELQAFSTLELSGIVDKLPNDLRNSWAHYIHQRPSPLPLPNLNVFSIWLNERSAWIR